MATASIWRNLSTTVDIKLKDEVITHRTLTRILLSVIEFLSYNRNQIPFVYETFNHLVNGFASSGGQAKPHEHNITSIALSRQRSLAVKIRDEFEEIAKILYRAIKQYDVEQAFIIFGATISTAKEAFVVNMPARTLNHSVENHSDSVQTVTRKVIMPIISSTEYFDVNCTELKPTNMHIMLKSRHRITDECLRQHDSFRLPAMCRTTMMNIENDSDDSRLNCCQRLAVYDDMVHLINDKLSVSIGDNIGTSNRTDQHQNKMNIRETDDMGAMGDTGSKYYECAVIVKGFKNQLIKGQSIWTQ